MVTVLMSTYNGEKYLRQQIDSILHQEGVEVSLLVRDDGSQDQTTDILDEYASQGLLSWYSGSNMGPAMSFMQLLRDAPSSEYYAFSDQDDYWMPDKLLTAVKALEEEQIPSLYFCQTLLTDADLHPIGSVVIHPRLTFGESLVYEFIGGCTMVFNRQLATIVNSHSPSFVTMHDVWVYVIAQSAGSHIVFDSKPHILYRQHTSNAIGQGYSRLHEWKRRWRRLSDKEQIRYRTARELLMGYKAYVTPDNLPLLSLFVEAKHSFVKRMRLLMTSEFHPAKSSTWWLFKIAVFTNQY